MIFPKLVTPDGSSVEVSNLLARPGNFLEVFSENGVSVPKEDSQSRAVAFAWAIAEGRSLFVGQSPSAFVLETIGEIERKRSSMEKSPLIWFSSSGSTGSPKLIGHTAPKLISSAKKIIADIPDIKGGVFPTFFPLHYMAGVLNTILVPWLAEGSSILTPQFNAVTPRVIRRFDQLAESGIVWVSPTMLRALLVSQVAIESVQKWSRIITATGPLSQEDWAAARDRFSVPVTNTYGSTEQLFVSTNSDNDRWMGVGKTLPGVTLVAPSSEEAGRQLMIKTDTPADLISGQTDGGDTGPLPNPLLTADVGRVRPDGGIDLVGRSDDIVSLGGINTNLSLYETAVSRIDGVVASLAVIISHDSPKSIVLLVEPADGFEGATLESIAWSVLEDSMDASSLPGRIIFTRLPRLASGKIDRQHRKAWLER